MEITGALLNVAIPVVSAKAMLAVPSLALMLVTSRFVRSSVVRFTVPAVTVPPKNASPAATYNEYGLVIVTFVPALGAPAMYRVEALV